MCALVRGKKADRELSTFSNSSVAPIAEGAVALPQQRLQLIAKNGLAPRLTLASNNVKNKCFPSRKIPPGMVRSPGRLSLKVK